MTAFDSLMAHARDTAALDNVMTRLGWDQRTMMPHGAAHLRSEELAALETVLHQRRTDPRIGDWLEAAEAPDDAGTAALRELRRAYARNTRVPDRLAAELARVTAMGQEIWAEARRNDDVAAFLPILRQVTALRREEAAAIAAGGDLYDALMQDYEPGASGAETAAMFDRMRPRLVALREKILDRPAPEPLRGTFPQDGQLRLARKLAEAFGYDFAHGRLDLTVHPFCAGHGEDVRITTRVVETEPFNCFYSTIHEVGHAAYEQGVDPAYALSPLGRGVSMGVHESQTRIYENQLGRSRAFTGWVFEQMQAEFGPLNLHDADAFHAAVNRVHAGYIRTEADEIHYNLHIMMRFDLERSLLRGEIEAEDLEDAWNQRFEADFGVAVDRPANGLLQDVHWSAGLFGYFPTYTLGNVYAGCLFKTLSAALPGLDADLAQGKLSAPTAWLRENLQRHGALRAPRATIEAACGFTPDEGPLLDYLEAKFGALYQL